MGVIADGLDVAEECKEEAEANGKVLDGIGDGGLVAVEQSRCVGGGASANDYGDDGGKCDGGGCQHRGGHDVVAHRLHRKNTILEGILQYQWRTPRKFINL